MNVKFFQSFGFQAAADDTVAEERGIRVRKLDATHNVFYEMFNVLQSRCNPVVQCGCVVGFLASCCVGKKSLLCVLGEC